MDYSEKGLTDKLVKGGYPAYIAAEAVEKLVDAHYVDDRRFADSYLRGHLFHKSLLRVRMDLKRKGVPDPIIQEAIEAYEESQRDLGDHAIEDQEIEQILRLLQKRRYDPKTADYTEKQRQMAYLMRRGYSMDAIHTAIDKLLECV